MVSNAWLCRVIQAGMSAWQVSAIRHFVVLFPALDVCSAFPLTAITLVRQQGVTRRLPRKTTHDLFLLLLAVTG